MTSLLGAPIELRVPLTEGVSGDEPESERDAASCGLARNHAPGRHRKPALRYYERTTQARSRASSTRYGTRMITRRNVNDVSAGPEANKSPQWSAERRASPARGLRKRICAGCETPVGVCGPTLLAREGCLASTRAPVGAPLPSFVRGHIGKPRRTLPRENDEVCLTCSPHEAKRNAGSTAQSAPDFASLHPATCSGTRDPRGAPEWPERKEKPPLPRMGGDR